ncbi:MAG: bifunctional hydroxymethylpyrimidine kinase/phosphomethylpyrimidine kinase [Bacillaceae bacterium]|nr:bifunctional hydroxymethylpyrimidine kinase/phosphomethylpyrimidine kinase [Bacillaceae bacterium]
MKQFKALTIAGSDSGGGAGIQADLKTFQELGVFGMSALTAVTAQNTLGVQGIYPLSTEAVTTQIRSIAEDMGTDALKTGMLFHADIITAVAELIKQNNWERLVVDPVMVAKGGARLLQEEAVQAMFTHLIPLALVVTPNIPEAEVLSGITIKTMEDRKEAAQRLVQMGAKTVVVKGGHDQDDDVIDLFYDGSQFAELRRKRIQTRHTHGTGCTFSAALTAELAKGKDVLIAVETARDFIQAAIEEAPGIGKGHGPTDHGAYRRRLSS